MKYIAIIDAEEKPVSCEFIGCNGNITPYLIGATTDIKVLEQEHTLDKIRAEIESINLNEVATKYEDRFYGFQQEALAILDKYKAESEGEK